MSIIYEAGSDYDKEMLFEELKRLYGDTYITTFAYFGSKLPYETYRWDMEDGVSIMWLLEAEPGLGTSVFMVYTEDIAEVESPETEERDSE